MTYNAENRPVRWEQGDVVVTMDFDRMGRRTFYKEMNGNTQVTFTRFIYKDYLCVRQVFSNSPYNTYKNFVWDPTETIATRPLKLQLPTMSLNLFYMHDGNKNVSDVVYRLTSNGIAAHYDYAPFGAVTRSISNAVPTADITTLNPFRFSSEYHDDTLGLVYYNYRHYNPTDGRWCGRDFIDETILGVKLFFYVKNSPLKTSDWLGLSEVNWSGYKVLNSVPESAMSGMGAYTVFYPARSKDLLPEDAICTKNDTCYFCECLGESISFLIEFDSEKSWVLSTELNNEVLRRHENNILKIAQKVAVTYTTKLKAIKGVGRSEKESVAREKACAQASEQIIELFNEFELQVSLQTFEYEKSSSFGRNEW